MDQIHSKTYCSVPWTQIATNASGYYRVCCNAIPGQNLILDDNNQPMKIYQNPIDQAWQSKTYQTIREEMLSNKRPSMCQRCFREEDSGLESPRQRWNKRWSSEFSSETHPPMSIKYIDLRLGNLCNLKCRMCNPYASNKWVDEWNKVVNTAQLVPSSALSEEESQRLKKMDWPTLEKTWENLLPVLDVVEEIYLTGGEPFLSLEQTKLLEKIIQSGRSKDITLKYNTNLTLLPEKLIPLWKEFKTVKLNVSIDGLGPLLNYIRFPADWDILLQNLNKIFLLKQEGVPLDIGVHTTVQMYNILSLPEITKYFKENFETIPYFNILNHPNCLNIRTLPQALKKKISSEIELGPFSKELSSILLYMNEEDWNAQYFDEFLTYTDTLDSLRKQSFKKLFPEFY